MAVKWYSYSKDKNIKLSDHFAMWEFCSYSDYFGNYPESVPIDDRLVPMLEELYEHFNCGRIDICSGYRTAACDKSVGGSGSGPHTYGKAVDAYCYYKNGSPVPSRLVACYLQDRNVPGIGLNCGGNSNGTHFDFLDRTWRGDEVDYSAGHEFYSYTGTSRSEVYPNGEKSSTNTKASESVNAEAKSNSTSFTTSDKAVKMIKSYEGLSLKACKAIPSETYWTIGYGHYGADVGANQVITEPEAEQLLKNDLKKFEEAVKDCVKVSITQSQFDALVSLAYNIGVGAIAASDIVSFLNKGKLGHACVDFPSWRKAGGQILAGLEKRRKSEMELFGLGCDFKLTDNMNIRTGSSTSNRVKKVSEITANGKKCVLSSSAESNAIFKAGTVVTALEFAVDSQPSRIDVWLKCPSGWICARQGNDVFIE